MTIKYIPRGDKFKASQLWGEGRHQLSILKNAMSFQNLKQLQRIARFDDGTIIKCLSCFGQDVINVFVPEKVVLPEKPEEKILHDYFRFRITRDDGEIIDETLLRRVTPGIGIYRKIKEYPDPEEYWQTEMVGLAVGRDPSSSNWTKDGDVWFYEGSLGTDKPFKFSYNIKTQIWTVHLFTWVSFRTDYELEDISLYDRDYWVEIRCEEESVDCWFARETAPDRGYVYKKENFFDHSDRVEPAFYNLTVPVWIVEEEDNHVEYVDATIPTFCDNIYAFFMENPHNYRYPRWNTTHNYFYEKIKVKSSIPYTITERKRKTYASTFTADGYTANGGYWQVPWNPTGTPFQSCEPGAFCGSFPADVHFVSNKINVIAVGDGPGSPQIIEEYTVTPETWHEKEYTISMTFSYKTLTCVLVCNAGVDPEGNIIWQEKTVVSQLVNYAAYLAPPEDFIKIRASRIID